MIPISKLGVDEKGDDFLKKTIVRKADHLRLGITESVESNIDPGFNDVKLIHISLPEIDLAEVDVSVIFLNHHLQAPLVIESITGGTLQATRINRNLAEAAEEIGIAIGVGSQRAALEDEKMIETYNIVRDKAPSVPVLANLGAPQLLGEQAEEYAKEAVDMLNADALLIHLNALQEAVQPEGQTNFKGVIRMISKIVNEINVPVIVKETGAGISHEVAECVKSAGVSIIDVAGLGGTSWAAVEYYRASRAGKDQKARLGKTFWDWGIPTVVSLVEVSSISGIKAIASGGVRTGIDVAKALALGADLTGMALPLLKPAMKDSNQVKKILRNMIEELKTAMFLTGAVDVNEMRKVPLVITGMTREWLTQRGFDIQSYSRRCLRPMPR